MRKLLSYSLDELEPYINWVYFFHAWGVAAQGGDEPAALRRDALSRLQALQGRCRVQALFGLFEANADGDDILVDSLRMPMLRQQHAHGGPCLCLADFVRPLSSGQTDHLGVFATCAPRAMLAHPDADPYQKMLSQTLADRLAEAAAERLHEQVRKDFWGYARGEQLSMEQMLREEFQGIRPAVGYPAMPDASLNFIIDELIGMKQIGIRLTATGMMTPHASVCGLMMAHPQARYFSVGPIGDDQLADYARRRGIPVEMARRFLGKPASTGLHG